MKTVTLTVRRLLAIVILSILGTSGTVYAVLFIHTVPSVTVTPPALSTSCASATLIASPASITAGSAGTVTLQCPGNAAVFTSTGGTGTPSFSLPAGYTSLTIASFVATTSPCTAGTALTSNSAVLVPAGSYEYCVSYTAPVSGTIPSFTIAWS